MKTHFHIKVFVLGLALKEAKGFCTGTSARSATVAISVIRGASGPMFMMLPILLPIELKLAKTHNAYVGSDKAEGP